MCTSERALQLEACNITADPLEQREERNLVHRTVMGYFLLASIFSVASYQVSS